jgi:hypothetical protein
LRYFEIPAAAATAGKEVMVVECGVGYWGLGGLMLLLEQLVGRLRGDETTYEQYDVLASLQKVFRRLTYPH